jgi:hypothetical protein
MTSLVAALAVTTWSCSGHVADTCIGPGDLVRVTAPSLDLDKGVGTVAALETDTIVVQVGERVDALHVPLADVKKLEVQRGQQSRADRGVLIGAGAGAALGVITALTLCAGDKCSLDSSDLTGLTAVFFGVGGAGIGALIGSSIGSNVQTDRWEEVPLDELRVGPSSVDADGVEVSVRLRL